MKGLAFVCALLFSLAGAGCAEPVQAALLATIPSTVRLYGPGLSCTAVYVGAGVFVTAAHCVKDQPLVWLEDQEFVSHIAVPLVSDEEKDIATLLALKGFDGPAVKISHLLPEPGQQILSIGYPGFYNLSLFFEVGFIKDLVVINKTATIISSNLAYRGYSGGPVLLASTGELVGISSAMTEIVTALPDQTHQHNTLSFIIAAVEVRELLGRTQIYLDSGDFRWRNK